MRFVKHSVVEVDGVNVQFYLDSLSSDGCLISQPLLELLKLSHEQSDGYASNQAAKDLVADIVTSINS
jgi:hypothetical protein